MAQVRIVSSLADVDAALQDLHITDLNQANKVRFRLDERAPLQEAANITVRTTHPGSHGFILVNPELLKCKLKAKTALETSFNTMLDASLELIDQELQGVEASIAALKVFVRYDDNQMPHNGPPLLQRNRGVQHVIYPHPPFPRAPSFENGTPQQRVPYQPAYATQQERDEAAARDRRAQRAIWHAKLRILEARQSILKDKRSEMMSKMMAEFKRIMDERSDLGAGYADDGFPPLA
ncbi:uncharacterized protein LOC123422103 [Hordeum vulgare subsp. vulgare]|uniref:Uncharacterized protein n=1 Tax=Hordeum vulgare subsp. vulgare TaxID=112509 RepID=A0A8I6WMD4_HORVV|nr:uncharacterized protein LOC123422103 [Hordeum vulgare subsp. vulgare]